MWYNFFMEHIRMDVSEDLYQSRLWDFYYSGRSVCVLDIETTGLDRRRNRFILGGLYDPKERQLHQVFAEDISEEAEALAEFTALVKKYDVIVTYNGRHFDLPFLEERLRRTGLASGYGSGYGSEYESGHRTGYGFGYDLDLYQVVNGHSPLRRLLPNLKQKTVEAYMGLWADRSDEISGAESVQLYEHYTRTKDPQARRQILLHNSDDVLQLTRLMKVLEKCDVHQAMYRLGFPIGAPRRRWQVRRIRLSGQYLLAEGEQGADPLEYRGFGLGEASLQSAFDAKAGTFRLEYPVLRRSGITAADLRAAGLAEESFRKYPDYGSGFLCLEDPEGIRYREVNHFVKALVRRLEESMQA